MHVNNSLSEAMSQLQPVPEGGGEGQFNFPPASLNVDEAHLERIVQSLTLSEKVGQMFQVDWRSMRPVQSAWLGRLGCLGGLFEALVNLFPCLCTPTNGPLEKKQVDPQAKRKERDKRRADKAEAKGIELVSITESDESQDSEGQEDDS